MTRGMSVPSVKTVAPYTGAWIEIPLHINPFFVHIVAPYTGAWIEIVVNQIGLETCASLPTRERGLKSSGPGFVAQARMSLPTRERGLKSSRMTSPKSPLRVAPYTGAWIEIFVE